MSHTTNPTKRRKSTQAVVTQRVEEVLRIRLDGAQLHDIRAYAGENGWQLSDSMLRKLIGKADELLKQRQDRKRSRMIALQRARITSLYARCVATADYRTALACLEAEAKLLGLYPDHRGLEKQLRALLKRLEQLEVPRTNADDRFPTA